MRLHVLGAHRYWHFLAAIFISSGALAAEPWSALISPENSLEFGFLKNDSAVCRLGLAGWGPNWQWVGLGSKQKASGEALEISVPFVVNQAKGEVIDIKFQARKAGAREVRFVYDLTAAKDVPVTMLVATLSTDPAFSKGEWVLTQADGQTATLKLPVGISSRPAVSKAVLRLEQAGSIVVTLDPPCAVAFDKDLRVLLAHDLFKAGSRAVTLTVTLP